MTATLEDQLQYEERMRDLGMANALRSLEAAEEGGRGDDTPMGSALVKQYVMAFSRALTVELTEDLGTSRKFKNYAPLLMALDPDAVSLVTLSRVVIQVTKSGEKEGLGNEKRVTLTSLAGDIGRTLYAELALSAFHDLNPDLYEALTMDHKRRMSKDLRHRLTVFKMQAAKNGIELPEWTPKQKVQVGMYLIHLLSEWIGKLPPLINIFLSPAVRGQSSYLVEFGEHAQHIVKSVYEGMLARVGQASPCLIPPQSWTGETGVGGFYGALKVRAVRFFKGHSKAWEIMQSKGCDATVLLQMLNAHQRVAWKINPYMLQLLKDMRSRGFVIPGKVEHTGMHSRMKPPRPEWLDTVSDLKLLDDTKAAAFKAWKVRTRDWHTELKRLGRVESKLNMLLKVGSEFLDVPKFYYVFQADSRGRMYPVSGVLNPQGSDVQKCVLHAAEGEPISNAKALWWYKLSMAGKFGVDKLAPDECVKWVDDHEREILGAAADPLDKDAFNWWSQADKPLQFIATCDEYRQYKADPENFISRIAVAMDGTCNGLQNYSALLRDPLGGAATNLLPQEDNVPSDIYGDVAKAAYKRLLRDEPSVYRNGWMEHTFNRKVTKKSTMTLVYGSTFGTCRDSVIDYCKDAGIFAEEEYEYADYAAKLIWAAIGDVVVKAVECMGWLRKVASKLFKGGVEHISWVAPSGFRVVQLYEKRPLYRIRANIGKSTTVQISLRDFDGTVGPDKRKNGDSLPPNFIHSVDASHMAYVSVGMAKENPGGFMHFIHDDFGVLANHAETLYHVIRNEFITLHNNFNLESLFQEHGIKIPEPPAKGTLDLEAVRGSINFFR